MTTKLILAPSLQSAQRHLIGQIDDLKRDDPAAPAIVLAPSEGAGQHLSYRLGNSLNIRIYPFEVLGREILDQAGKSMRKANALTIERLVTHLLEEMASEDELTTFDRVHEKPGFIRATIDWLGEMKSRNIKPADVEYEAKNSGRERDRQLAILYHRYQDFLDNKRLVDHLGFVSLAADAIELGSTNELREDVLFVIGFDHFSPLELRLLHQLASILPNIMVYLPWNRKLPADGQALGRINRTRRQLEAALEPKIRHLDDDDEEPVLLKVIRNTLFTPISEKPVQGLDHGEIEPLRAVAAPSREAEVREALRSVKELLLEGINPREVAILATKSDVYSPLLMAVAKEYEMVVDVRVNLETNPAVSALINLLKLAPDFPWRQTFDALRSPYLKQSFLTVEQIFFLEELTRERPVISGRDQWGFALKPQEIRENDQRSFVSRKLVAQRPPEELEAIKEGLWKFFDQISPRGSKSYSEHIAWLQDMVFGIGPELSVDLPESDRFETSFNMAECCRESKSAQEDVAALDKVLSALRQLKSAADLVPAGTGRKVSWTIFRRDLLEALETRFVPKDPGSSAIHFSNLDAVRWLSADFIFVLGLAEGEFPRLRKADPFYASSERANSNLPLKIEDPNEFAGLWWQTISNSRRSLTILRPRLDENGVPWLPSPFWQVVVDQLPDSIERILPVESRPSIKEAASRSELLLALANANANTVPFELEEQWQGVIRALGVMDSRSNWGKPGIYEGVLEADDLLRELSQEYGSNHIWSPSRLNRYGNCPYGFFAEQILQFKAKADPEEGFDAMQRGSLIHAILETLYKELISGDMPASLPVESELLEKLEKVCDRNFSRAAYDYDFRPGPLWIYEQRELRRILRAFIRWDLGENQEKGDYKPSYLELFFGFPGSRYGILTFEVFDGFEIKVHGVIDRVDVNTKGQAIVIDYKSGSGKFYNSDISRGLAFQTPLYALAVEQLFKSVSSVLVSKYLHVPSRDESGVLKFSGPVSENEMVSEAIEQAGGFVHNVRHGFFPSAPGKPTAGSGLCRSHCELASICRVTRISIAKVRTM
jgi:ATP-dependent helicase/DNAse subunit B